ncbi:unnamed protein product [Caenorhabditis auriculariae]|uniref:VWFA domain-containing protein n=1 Tax=Caenorhabditis auriculariae TaxID=2777116 RepID=A0A8S1HDR0_9PELO|nr:unnamed protein product [Caenorhabditis auriculariae]
MKLLQLSLVALPLAFACVDVLFVVDSSSDESRRRALDVADSFPPKSTVRRWAVVSKNDRYIPRVVRNNFELIAILHDVLGDYKKFLEVTATEIARRRETFRPFVVLLFSETPVDEATLQKWKDSSKSPALHIFRIASPGKKKSDSLLEQREKFEEIISCGLNNTTPVRKKCRSLLRIQIPTSTRITVVPLCKAEIFFVIDLSQGTGDKSKQYLDIAASIIGSLPIGKNAVRVGLISYSGRGRTRTLVQLDKHESKDELIEEMFRMERAGGTTRTGDAIRYAVDAFENEQHATREGVRRVLVVFTDGYSQDEPREAADEARNKKIDVVAVAVEDKRATPDSAQLTEIAGSPQNVLISPSGKHARERILGLQCKF